MSRSTLNAGFAELKALENKKFDTDNERIRPSGGGRKQLAKTNHDLVTELESLIDPVTRGDTDSPLRWTVKSTRTLATELTKKGFSIGKSAVATLLDSLGYSLQSNQKRLEGAKDSWLQVT